MPIGLGFGTPSERVVSAKGPRERLQPNLQQPPSQRSSEVPSLDELTAEAEAMRLQYPTRKIRTPMPVEWGKKKKKARIDAAQLTQIMGGR